MYYKDWLEIIGDWMDEVDNDPMSTLTAEDYINYIHDMDSNPWD